METERNDEDPHGRFDPHPKLTLAGRIDGSIDGRPVTIVGEGAALELSIHDWRSLLTSTHSWRTIVEPLRALLTRSDIRFMVRIKWLGTVEVLPNPGLLVRLMLPH